MIEKTADLEDQELADARKASVNAPQADEAIVEIKEISGSKLSPANTKANNLDESISMFKKPAGANNLESRDLQRYDADNQSTKQSDNLVCLNDLDYDKFD